MTTGFVPNILWRDNLPKIIHACPYGVQLPTVKTSGKSSPQKENYTEFYTIQSSRKKTKTEVEQTDVKVDSSGEAELKQTVENLNKSIKHDHDYSLCVRLCLELRLLRML